MRQLSPRVAALGLVAMLASTVTAALVLYNGGLARSVQVTVESGRSGLSMQSGAAVKMHGVEVGRVQQVRQVGDGAVIDLGIDADAAQDIPANIGVEISSSTVFGTKYVDLVAPATAAVGPITEGTRIAAERVSVELNSVFEDLSAVLRSVEPEKVNAVLGAVATALTGRGDRLGQSLEDADAVLASINSVVPQLESDVRN
ncbi:MCE family protein, partial [Rhodococcus sp. NPDC058514]